MLFFHSNIRFSQAKRKCTPSIHAEKVTTCSQMSISSKAYCALSIRMMWFSEWMFLRYIGNEGSSRTKNNFSPITLQLAASPGHDFVRPRSLSNEAHCDLQNIWVWVRKEYAKIWVNQSVPKSNCSFEIPLDKPSPYFIVLVKSAMSHYIATVQLLLVFPPFSLVETPFKCNTC